ncbi:3-methyl-2-oxobutanoate hydroxymethyltransferase [Phascolomyces articulosus]|uniref:3-methyl-2-oxobutanoate hydroxymethyltransferase n=1 Tax=Phascolomyces articulosus TaxID=60185 RepID=A0AAD5PE19_9FUNG|nr:3-methyl-2-oxobutanoate hydroxymethyltransferase [Phascolomyces articulosus]
MASMLRNSVKLSKSMMMMKSTATFPKAAIATPPAVAVIPPCRFYSSRPVDSSSSQGPTKRPKVTIKTIGRMHRQNEPITVMTAQDYPSGMMVDRSGIDMCLVGDSLAMVALGYESTTSLTVDEMLHHCRAVARGSKNPFLIGDLPFGSFEASPVDAVKVAQRFIKEGNVEAVKLEGGAEMAEHIKAITRVGVPVMGHIGLTPQRSSALGGFRVQGKTAKQAQRLLEDALAIQEAGVFAMVLEAMPAEIAGYITQQLKVPTIGIGAGVNCSGQVLVMNDIMGLFDRFVPK